MLPPLVISHYAGCIEIPKHITRSDQVGRGVRQIDCLFIVMTDDRLRLAAAHRDEHLQDFIKVRHQDEGRHTGTWAITCYRQAVPEHGGVRDGGKQAYHELASFSVGCSHLGHPLWGSPRANLSSCQLPPHADRLENEHLDASRYPLSDAWRMQNPRASRRQTQVGLRGEIHLHQIILAIVGTKEKRGQRQQVTGTEQGAALRLPHQHERSGTSFAWVQSLIQHHQSDYPQKLHGYLKGGESGQTNTDKKRQEMSEMGATGLVARGFLG